MSMLAAAEDRAGALTAYNKLRERLREQLGHQPFRGDSNAGPHPRSR